VGFSDSSAFLSALLNIQNPLPVELQAFQQTDSGHFIAKGFVVGRSRKLTHIEDEKDSGGGRRYQTGRRQT
jgi:hypothetical protein